MNEFIKELSDLCTKHSIEITSIDLSGDYISVNAIKIEKDLLDEMESLSRRLLRKTKMTYQA